ncbi:MAG: HDIG domain-containing metalloprotein [bacterium]
MRRKGHKIFEQERVSKYIPLLKSVFLGKKTGRTLLIILILGILSLLITPNLIITPYPKETEVSPNLIKAPYDFLYENTFMTKVARESAVAKVNPVYNLDLKVIPSVLPKIKNLFEETRKIKEEKKFELEKTCLKFREKFPNINLSDKNLKAILNYPELSEIEEDITLLLKTWLTYGITNIPKDKLSKDTIIGIRLRILATDGTSEKLVETTENFFFLNDLPESSPLYPKRISSSKVQDGVFELAKNYLVLNLKFNEKETKKASKEAIKGVKPIRCKVSKGEKIVGEGEKVDRDAAMKLAELSKHRSAAITTRNLGFILLIYILIILSFIYLYKYQSQLLIRNKNLSLIGLIIITAIALAKVISTTNLPFHLMPMSAFAILLSVLLNQEIAIFVTVILNICVGLLVGERMEFVLLFVAGSLAAVYTTSQLKLRGDLIRAGVAAAIAQGVIIVSYSLFRQESFGLLQQNLLLGSLANGIIATIIAMGSLLYLERIFNIATNFTLFELSDLNAPLLKNLLLKAPGTYHHSLLVGNIAESGANAIGANYLLTRVASYYHDIGKMIRPEYFIENQTEFERNRHEVLRSTLSASVLRSHIKDGVEVAKRNRLPHEIIEIIQQHHGSSVMAYFYHQAREKETTEEQEFKETEFSYLGPKPQSKEAAIVMLADSCEAASRTLIKPTTSRIEKLVKKIIDDRFISGELDECDLTLKDLNKISQAFTRVLITLFHARVEYPEKEQQPSPLFTEQTQDVKGVNSQQDKQEVQGKLD